MRAYAGSENRWSFLRNSLELNADGREKITDRPAEEYRGEVVERRYAKPFPHAACSCPPPGVVHLFSSRCREKGKGERRRMTERTAGGFVEWRVKLCCIQIVSFLVAPKMDRRPLSPDFSVKPGIFFFFKGRRKKEEFLLLERCVPWLTAAIKRRRQLSNPILIVFRNRISSTWLPHYSTNKTFPSSFKEMTGKRKCFVWAQLPGNECFDKHGDFYRCHQNKLFDSSMSSLWAWQNDRLPGKRNGSLRRDSLLLPRLFLLLFKNMSSQSFVNLVLSKIFLGLNSSKCS